MIARTTVTALAVALSALHARPVQGQSLAAVVLPLPAGLRARATIVRLNSAFQLEVLRRGTNGMVCIDARHNSLFDVRCYRDSFIQVVYRAFQLGYDVDGEKVGDEVKAGKLQLSREPTAGYRCLGPAAGYDAVRNAIDARIECWESVHFPFRTAAEVGFPDEADVPQSRQSTTPYVMASGSYWSHVMIRHPHD